MSDSLVTDGNTKLTQHSAVLAPKSLRTKTFSRPDILNVKKSDHEIFLEKGLQTLKKGTFNQIDTVCQLNKYER